MKQYSARTIREQDLIKGLSGIHTCYGFRGNPSKLKMALLTAYFDESGTGHHERLCVVAGFVGNDAQWTALVADWIPALGQRKNLHMTKLRGWSNQKKRDRIVSDLAKLGPIPHKYNLTPVAVRMFHRDHEQYIKDKVSREFTEPYLLCAQTCISTVLTQVAGPDDDVLFIFDRQEGRRAVAMNKLRDISYKWAKLDRRLKDVHFLPFDSTVCLDPSDYLAFQTREYYLDSESEKAVAGMSIMALSKTVGGIFSQEQLEFIADRLSSDEMSPELYQDLLRAGWSDEGIAELMKRLGEKNEK